MNVQSKTVLGVIETPKYFDVFGFRIPMTSDGRRIWSPKFKQHVVSRLASGEMTTAQVSRKCDIKKSLVYQWKSEVAKCAAEAIHMDTSDKPFVAFGFEIAMTNDGRRQWSKEFKEYIVDKHAKGQLSSAKIAKVCDVDRSMVYQWRRDVRGYCLKQRAIEPDESNFAEVKVEAPTTSPSASLIILRMGNAVLELPTNYSPQSLAELMRAL